MAEERKLTRSSLNDIAPNNSDRARRAQESSAKKKLKPVVTNKATVKKRTAWDKIKDAFIGENDSVGDFILYDVAVPAFRNTMSDLGVGIIEGLFGNSSYNSRGRRGGVVRDRGRSYISYNSIDDGRSRRDSNRSSRARHDFDNIIFTTRNEAEDVLSHLVDLTLEYGEASVREFYELSGIEANYTDDKYGWTNLRDAYVNRSRDGHIIIFPATRVL